MAKRRTAAVICALTLLSTAALAEQPAQPAQPNAGPVTLALPLILSGPSGSIAPAPNPSATPTTPTVTPTTPTATPPTVTPTTPTATPTTPTATPPTVTPTTPTATPPTVPPPDEASARLSAPAGFAVRIYAAGLGGPRLMAVGPDGALYVAERSSGRVSRLPDANGDGLADARQTVISGLTAPHSLEWHAGALYVAETDRVSRLSDQNGDGDFADDGERATVVSGLPNDGGHSTRTAHVGPDGKLYVAVGSKCNIPTGGCSEGDPRRAAILRYNLDGSIPADNPFAGDPDTRRRAVWAEGLRNSVDFLFTADGRLWATHNGSDGLGDDLPPEEIVIEVQAGKHHGWPYCYTPLLPAPAANGVGAVPPGTQEVRDTRVPLSGAPIGSCAEAVPARYTDLGHYAPLGATLYGATAFPAAYRGGLFVAYHGSWNADNSPRDCRVQFIAVEGGAPTRGEAFLTGFRDSASQECGGAWGRPAGVVVGPGGELFVSDDKRGAIYRVVYVGP